MVRNENAKGKYVIIKDLNFSDFMKDEKGNTNTYDTLEQALDVCGMYEFENVLVCKIELNYLE